jgi:branched-chain amino acid transport system substrate-binding protein
MTKRLFALLATLVLASLLLAACGGGAAPEEPAAPAEEPMEEPMEEPTEAPAEEPMEEPAMYECTDPIGCAEIAPDEPVHIAYMLTISGATAFLGEDSQGAIEIAIDDRGGELLGHELQLTGEDSLCSAEGGQTAATKLASDPSIIGVIGSNCSSAATAAMPTISGAGLVMLSPSNTAPALTLEGETWQPGYFRICHTDLFQGSVAAEFAYNELGATTAATIHDGSPYADQLQAVFAGRFQELGGTITFQGAVNVGDTDMRTVLTSVAAFSRRVVLPDLRA